MPGDLHRRLAKLEEQEGHVEWADLRDPAYREEMRRSSRRKLIAIVWQWFVQANGAETMTQVMSEQHSGWPDAFTEDERAQMIWDDLVRGTPLQSQLYRALKDNHARRGIQ